MISIHEATKIIQDHLPRKESTSVKLQDALGLVSAEDILAPEPSPRYSNSAMDGFAVQWGDVQSTSSTNPALLKIVGESQAGIPFQGAIKPGEAIRISTGAMMAEGADTIVPIEEVEVSGTSVTILKVRKKGQNLRYEGEEFKTGDLLIPQGMEIQPPQIALLASVGIAKLDVYTNPQVAIIVTGTELVSFDQPAKPWQIRDSNGIMLSGVIQQSGGNVKSIDKVPDSLEQTIDLLERIVEESNMVILSGGVSVGPHDHIKEAVQKIGFETLFWRVKIKPGKPLLFAKKSDTLLFGLPGNPVSAFMCYSYFIHPVIQQLCGKTKKTPMIKTELAEPIHNTLDRAHLMRIQIIRNSTGQALAYPLEKQGSHMISTIVNANGFVLVDVGESLDRGEFVEVFLFPWERI